MWVCENLHMSTSEFADKFGCLPSTHVEASLKEWPNNHVKECILEELLVQFYDQLNGMERETGICKLCPFNKIMFLHEKGGG